MKQVCTIEGDIEVFVHTVGSLMQNMYVLKKKGELLIVDPNISQELKQKITDLQITDITVFLTHEHYDHITGVKWLKKQFPITLFCSERCKEALKDFAVEVNDFFDILLKESDRQYYMQNDLLRKEAYDIWPDKTYTKDFRYDWDGIDIKCLEAPGHSPGGSIYIIKDKYVFTGDNLVNGQKVITRFPNGNKKEFQSVTRPVLQSLQPDSMIFPGHGECGELINLLQYL
jgi:glyoxylase-like metal-dependent hydrolase (beta-lactamase superfamily II)